MLLKFEIFLWKSQDPQFPTKIFLPKHALLEEFVPSDPATAMAPGCGKMRRSVQPTAWAKGQHQMAKDLAKLCE